MDYLLRNFDCALKVLVDVMGLHKLFMNLGVGKFEAIMHLVGENFQKTPLSLFRRGASTLSCADHARANS